MQSCANDRQHSGSIHCSQMIERIRAIEAHARWPGEFWEPKEKSIWLSIFAPTAAQTKGLITLAWPTGLIVDWLQSRGKLTILINTSLCIKQSQIHNLWLDHCILAKIPPEAGSGSEAALSTALKISSKPSKSLSVTSKSKRTSSWSLVAWRGSPEARGEVGVWSKFLASEVVSKLSKPSDAFYRTGGQGEMSSVHFFLYCSGEDSAIFFLQAIIRRIGLFSWMIDWIW